MPRASSDPACGGEHEDRLQESMVICYDSQPAIFGMKRAESLLQLASSILARMQLSLDQLTNYPPQPSPSTVSDQ